MSVSSAGADLDGELLIERTRPVPQVTCVGNGSPRHAHRQPGNVTDVLRHQPSPMS